MAFCRPFLLSSWGDWFYFFSASLSYLVSLSFCATLTYTLNLLLVTDLLLLGVQTVLVYAPLLLAVNLCKKMLNRA